MRISELKSIAEGVFKLESGLSDLKPDEGDILQLEFGGIQTSFTFGEFTEDDDVQ